jgi:hypothetical protein
MADDSSEIVREQSESVAATNIKTLGDGPAFFQNQMYAQAAARSQAMDQVLVALTGKVGEMIISTSPGEGGADTAALAALAKIIQGTPPPTNLPTQGQ